MSQGNTSSASRASCSLMDGHLAMRELVIAWGHPGPITVWIPNIIAVIAVIAVMLHAGICLVTKLGHQTWCSKKHQKQTEAQIRSAWSWCPHHITLWVWYPSCHANTSRHVQVWKSQKDPLHSRHVPWHVDVVKFYRRKLLGVKTSAVEYTRLHLALWVWNLRVISFIPTKPIPCA